MAVKVKQFYVTDECVSCGRCAKVCPVGNLQMQNGKPVWEDRCRYCMACLNRCKKNAIEYGIV